MTVLENIILAPTRVQGISQDEAINEAFRLLEVALEVDANARSWCDAFGARKPLGATKLKHRQLERLVLLRTHPTATVQTVTMSKLFSTLTILKFE